MIDQTTIDGLKSLALQIFNPNFQPNDPAHTGLGVKMDPAFYTGLKAWDPAVDQQYYNAIAPIMKYLEGRDMQTGINYTMNFTCALYGRPKKWLIEGFYEFKQGPNEVVPPCSVGFMYWPDVGENPPYVGDVGSYGFYAGGTICAGILNVWAEICRRWLVGQYPRAIVQPSG